MTVKSLTAFGGVIPLLQVVHLSAATFGHCQLTGGSAAMQLRLVVCARPQAHLERGFGGSTADGRGRGGTITSRKRRDLLAIGGGADILHILSRNGLTVRFYGIEGGRAARDDLPSVDSAMAGCKDLLGTVRQPAARATLKGGAFASKLRSLRTEARGAC